MRNLVISSLLIFAFLWTLAVGSIGTWVFIKKIIPQPSAGPSVIYSADDILYKEYDLLIVSEEKPRKILVFELVRDRDALGVARVHYFDGKWNSSDLFTYLIFDKKDTNQFVTNVVFNPTVGGKSIDVNVPNLYTPMVIRAEEDYVKFGGATLKPGEYMKVDGKPIKSYAALLKGYNRDFFRIDLEKYDVATDWLMYFDKDWNFYHLDKTDVGKPHPKYESHEFFSRISRRGMFGSVNYMPIEAIQNREGAVTITDTEGGVINLEEGPEYYRYGNRDFPAKIVEGADGGIGIYITVGK